jgi:uncharacterized RDD family membrane protein YckC
MPDENREFEYVGFWWRVAAAMIDTVVLSIIVLPLLFMIFGATYFEQPQAAGSSADILIQYVVPAVLVVGLWIRFQATPGKMLIKVRIVDARSGEAATRGQYIVRYIGYYLALLPLGLGILWVAFDRRKQGWHDKLARTVVIRA